MERNKLVITIIAGLVLMFGLISCGTMNPNMSASQQITKETNDPFIIARAAYADALDAYITAGNAYLPHKDYLERSNPELAEQILNNLREMRRILKDWKRFTDWGELPPSGDMDKFHSYRKIILQIILDMEDK